MIDDEVAVFEVSKFSGVLEIAMEFLIGCALFSAASYIVGEVTGIELWLSVLVMYGVAGMFLSRVVLRLRYRYILGIRYVVSPDGIRVEQDGTKSFFEWSEFSNAEFLSLTPIYRLWVTGQTRPIVLVTVGGMPGGRLDRRNRLAACILKKNIGTNLKTSRLPW